MAISLVSFAYPSGLPPEADLVFDARFLKNPFYDPVLRPLCGLDPEIVTFVEQDPDFAAYFAHTHRHCRIFIAEIRARGKKICNNLYRMHRRTTQICGYD